ncbi:N-acetylglutamate synthase [Vibrio lentus]|uniref:N-acetylglutamate synthase n=1 Tax=Vibrio lentus TaxID=136468 RepID=A0A2N7IFC3_9VIBR|nr:DUF2850 domain-containing protein [Vibrio lentus]OBS93358.1 N-acetylglutamate synthase [Vibrio tasmaniensis]MCC4818438.1 DUF2850 domain-containing protein [Vibrio lentus]PMG68342.1 N-acetylglutamate synthase [Vibrio lentus]PMH98331.1 N-acetylglutamate synthase [Vibrio lentus]PMJ84714.1 N-acetylglutamate synthase [Vibrio lentus]
MQQAPARKNKIDEITKGLYSEAEQRNQSKLKRKIIERSLMALALVGTFAVVSLFGDVINRVQDAATPDHLLYGTWVEQDVAHYATDEFVLNANGVSVGGSVISTNFEFDGNYFEYKAGDKTYRFRMTKADHTEMVLDSDGHYNPVFRLKGYIDNSVR